MEQHPVPQHIASYEFRLVGDMTLKQFGYLASGVVIGLIFYASPLPWYFKWPGVITAGTLGVAFAFLPVQERPLSQWFVAFFKAVFSPTQYLWAKGTKELEIFKATAQRQLIQRAPVPPPDQTQLTEYLKTLPGEGRTLFEKQEEGYLQRIMDLFRLTRTPGPTPTLQPKPALASFPTTPRRPFPPRLETEMARPPKKLIVRTAPAEAPTIKTGRPVVLPEKPGRLLKPSIKAKISSYLPIPAPPTQPNILVGMVLDKKDEMIEGAILEIRNSKGIPVRALKTNKLGQFRIATPLEEDAYEIEIEKEGYQFDIIKVEVKGEIIKPLEIRAK